MRGHIRDGNEGKARIKVLCCVMSDHIAADQVPEGATYKCVRGEMFPCGHSGHAYRRGKSVDPNLGRLVWIFGSYYPSERPACYRMSRWEAIREFAGSLRPA